MLKKIYYLLPASQRKSSLWLIITVFIRVILDFAGVASVIPIILLLMKRGSSRQTMLLLCCAVLVFVILKNLIVALLLRVQTSFQLNVFANLSKRMFINYYNRGLLFLREKSCAQLSYEVNYVCYFFSMNIISPLLRIASESIISLLILIALVVWEPLTGILLCLSFFLLAGIYVGFIRKKLGIYGKEELEARKQQSRMVIETFRGYPELEIAQAFERSLITFDEGLCKIIKNRFRAEVYQQFPFIISELSIVIGLTLLIATGNGALGIVGGVFAIAAFRLIPAVRSVLVSWVSFQNASHIIPIIEDGLKEEKIIDNRDDLKFNFTDSIKMSNVSYAYPNDKYLFENVNMVIHKGERVGIRGESGSGKSTMFNLLLGFIKPTKGEIVIDKTILTPTNTYGWHKIVGYVPQEIFICQGSIAENIALGQKIIDREKIEKVLRQVQLYDWVKRLKEGIDTQLFEYGGRISGGQKQRIGIARALYKDAEVLFFDEATSSLDNRTEKEINNALEDLSKECRELTMIIIAHRESSLTFCDRIYNLSSHSSLVCEK